MLVQQEYNQYTISDHEVWSVLYKRQYEKVADVAYNKFKWGLDQLEFNDQKIPDFKEVNKKLKGLTGWQIYAVPGLISNADFFNKMYTREFGTTTWIRKMQELDYLEEPDMFHDVFGHIPLLTDTRITHFLYELAALAVKHLDKEEVIEAIARVYWYTIEFGLVKENKQVKIYGAGILSSIGETEYSLSSAAVHVPFQINEVIHTPYIKDRFQEKYFVLDHFDQLAHAAQELNHFFSSLY